MGKKLIFANTTAGAGKTTYIKNRVMQYAQVYPSYKPDNGLYLAYTRINVHSAFAKKLPMKVKTIHAFAYWVLKQTRGAVPPILNVEVEEFNRVMRRKITATKDGQPFLASTKDDRMLQCYNYSTVAECSLEEAYKKLKLYEHNILLTEVEAFVTEWIGFKRKFGYIDFNDLLKMAIVEIDRNSGLLVDLHFLALDEAQDLSRLYWRFVESILANAPYLDRVLIVGDDDQSIYSFLNASDTKVFLEMPEKLAKKYGFEYEKKDWEHKSFRCPSNIFEFAKQVLKGVEERDHEKKMVSAEEGGIIEIKSREDVLRELIHSEDSSDLMVILERHNTQLWEWERKLKKHRIEYFTRGNLYLLPKWRIYLKVLEMLEKDELSNPRIFYIYMNQMMRAYQKKPRYPKNKSIEELMPQIKKDFETAKMLLKRDGYLVPPSKHLIWFVHNKPKAILSTIHGWKGEEANRVFVGADWLKTVNPDSDEEKRVYFVAFTRAKQKLILASEDLEKFSKLFGKPVYQILPS